jgi:hypothetical protein
MKSCKKYMSIFLLFVFTWVVLPHALVHELFADHKDTLCEVKHDHSIANVESLHTHCDIFTTNTPLYDSPELIVLSNPLRVLIDEYFISVQRSYFLKILYSFLSRGPPLS